MQALCKGRHSSAGLHCHRPTPPLRSPLPWFRLVAVDLELGSQSLLVGFATEQMNLNGTARAIMMFLSPTQRLLVLCGLVEEVQVPRLVPPSHPTVVPSCRT